MSSEPLPLAPDTPCPSGKIRHAMENKARKVIQSQSRKRKSVPFLRPYRCELCHDWHLTSLPNKRNKH